MKLFMGVAVAAMLMATPALAQTAGATTATTLPAPVPPSACGATTPAPTLPDGATASRAEMDTANTAFVAWAEANRAVVVCRNAEARALSAQADARASEHNAAAEAFNAAAAAWQVEVDEYNARPPRSRR